MISLPSLSSCQIGQSVASERATCGGQVSWEVHACSSCFAFRFRARSMDGEAIASNSCLSERLSSSSGPPRGLRLRVLCQSPRENATILMRLPCLERRFDRLRGGGPSKLDAVAAAVPWSSSNASAIVAGSRAVDDGCRRAPSNRGIRVHLGQRTSAANWRERL
jgi:hypothetical protein